MRSLLLGIALVCLSLVSCSNLLQTAGGTTDTGNSRILASIIQPNGEPVSGAHVIVRRSDYLSGGAVSLAKASYSQKETFTDESGGFEVDSVDTGSYTIEVNDRISAACLLACRIVPGDSQITLGAGTIHPYAIVEGNAAVPPRFTGTVSVQIYGLERRVPLDAAGHFAITDLPADLLRFRITAKDTSFTPISIDSVLSVSGKITEIPYIGWRFRQHLALNTTSSGADIAGAVYDFPVAVRLSRSTFNFSLAAKGGADLRFTKSNGEPLPYEIAQWDSAGGQAVAWVRVDTVFGNSSGQYIDLYYGFPGAASGSSGAAVFDTASGFQGVWHLDEAGNAKAKDATVNGYDGTPYNMTSAAAVAGAVGGARDFDGSSSYISMSGTANSKLSLPQNGSYTISAWAYADTFDSKYHVIAGKGHEQYYLKLKCISGAALWEFDEYEDKAGWAYSEVSNPPNSKSWVYIVGIRSGPLQQLFINGTMVQDTFGIMAGTLARNAGDDFTIGKYLRSVTVPYAEGYCPFNGKIDEVCLSNRARSADWIKLCYMNQRADDRLVVFAK